MAMISRKWVKVGLGLMSLGCVVGIAMAMPGGEGHQAIGNHLSESAESHIMAARRLNAIPVSQESTLQKINQSIAELVQSVGQMRFQIEGAVATQEEAASQVTQATEQSLNSGIQQTESLAEQLRNSMDSIAQDMMSMVSATRV